MSTRPKKPSPIVVTEFGMVMDVKRVQPPQNQSPIVVTESGMMMDVKRVQP